MPANYVLLGTQTVGNGGAASVTFSNIPQSGYTDLKLVVSARGTDTGSAPLWPTFNGVTTGYSYKRILGTGSNAISQQGTNAINGIMQDGSGATANTFGNGEMYIPNYTGSQQKSVSIDSVNEDNYGTSYQLILSGLWSNTAAITSITLTPEAGTISANSTFYLYGLAAVGTTPALAPFASGGDVIANDGTYWYHAFKTTGAFVPAKALNADILVVAGGGGGGGDTGAGGGAGGTLALASQALTATSTTVTVGAGGAGATTGAALGSKGVDSSFGSLLTCEGGGYGSYYGSKNGGNGGSGGGASQATGTAGTATSGQGSNGGSNSYDTSGAGGGGKGSVGSSATVGTSGLNGGNGGAGANTVTNWGSLSGALTAIAGGVSGYIAGGGGGGGHSTSGTLNAGGTGGSGGGGNGGNYSNAGGGRNTPTAGTANTGSGGGGDGWFGQGGKAGGSGIVIIRYAMA